MHKKNKILFFCPLPPPLGGQALISEIIYKLIRPRYLINTTTKNKFTDTIQVILKTFWHLIFHKLDLVYFTCTRSKKGAIKDIILLILCKFRGIKVMNHLHGNEVMDLFNGGLFSTIIHWSYRQIDTTIFVTERQKQLMPASLDKMKRVVISNCYDPILEEINRKISKKKEVRILFISFLMKSKGVFVALDVFELLAHEYKNVTFHIAGKAISDDLMSESQVKLKFEEKYQQLKRKFPKRIIYHGVVEGNSKIDLFTNSDILIFPTFFRTESFGLVNVEAMRAGNAIITTNHNFLPDIVSEKEGILVEPNNTESTYNALKYLLDNPNVMLNMQRHNIEHAKKYYSPDQFKKEIFKIFSEIQS